MRFLGKVLLTLLLLLLLLIVAVYVVLQTQWGAGWLSRQVSAGDNYQLSLGKIEHNFSSPAHLILDSVSFGRKGQPVTLVARRVNLGMSLQQFSNPLHFGSIRLEDGTLNLSENTLPPSLQADRLLLSQMAVNHSQGSWPLQAQRVNGGIVPWQPQPDNPLGNESSFQLSAGALTVKGLPASNVLVQGSLKDQNVVLNNVGADVALGSMTGNAQRNASGAWQLSNLRLNSIRLQTDKTLDAFLQPLLTLPEVNIGRVDITDARLEGRGWAVTDLDMVVKNITLDRGDWHSENGSLSMNASNVVNGELQLNDPIANMDFTPQGIALSQFSSRWVNGLVRATGNWNRSDRTLTLDEVMVAGLEYTLPTAWRESWLQTLPVWLDSVKVTKLSANRNLIIDINPDFPFQMTALDGSGSNLLLARDRQWGIWAGNLSFNAAEATFNRVDLRHPSIALSADNEKINVTEMSAFSGEGVLEGLANLSQQPERAFSLTLNGRQVPTNVLHNWGWPQLPFSGNGNLQLSVQGRLQKESPLNPSVNGRLSVNAGDKSVQQTMVNGQLQ